MERSVFPEYSDTPANYFIHNHRGADGDMINLSLKASFDSEIKLLKSLPQELITKISYDNALKFLLG